MKVRWVLAICFSKVSGILSVPSLLSLWSWGWACLGRGFTPSLSLQGHVSPPELGGIAWGVLTFWWEVAPQRCWYNWAGIWLEYLGFLNSWRSTMQPAPRTTAPGATWGKADLGVYFLPSCWLVTPARVGMCCSLGTMVRPWGRAGALGHWVPPGNLVCWVSWSFSTWTYFCWDLSIKVLTRLCSCSHSINYILENFSGFGFCWTDSWFRK